MKRDDCPKGGRVKFVGGRGPRRWADGLRSRSLSRLSCLRRTLTRKERTRWPSIRRRNEARSWTVVGDAKKSASDFSVGKSGRASSRPNEGKPLGASAQLHKSSEHPVRHPRQVFGRGPVQLPGPGFRKQACRQDESGVGPIRSMINAIKRWCRACCRDQSCEVM